MSSPICVKTLKYQCISKSFPLLCRQFFPFITLKQTIFFQPTTACEQFLWRKNNGPFLTGNHGNLESTEKSKSTENLESMEKNDFKASVFS